MYYCVVCCMISLPSRCVPSAGTRMSRHLRSEGGKILESRSYSHWNGQYMKQSKALWIGSIVAIIQDSYFVIDVDDRGHGRVAARAATRNKRGCSGEEGRIGFSLCA